MMKLANKIKWSSWNRKYSKYTVPFVDIRYKDHETYGMQSAILGETLHVFGNTPNGFLIKNEAIKYFLEYNEIFKFIESIEENLNTENTTDFTDRIHLIYLKILHAKMPPDLTKDVLKAYEGLLTKHNSKVIVRHSNFKNEMEYFVESEDLLLNSLKRCICDYYLEDDVIYRETFGIGSFHSKMTITVQQWIDSNGTCSGEISTRDPYYSSSNIFYVNAATGNNADRFERDNLPENEWNVMRSALKTHLPIIKKQLCDDDVNKFHLTNEQVLDLCSRVSDLKDHFKTHYDFKVDWKQNAQDGAFLFTNITPTLDTQVVNKTCADYYKLDGNTELVTLGTGVSIGYQIVHGQVAHMRSPKDYFQPGSIILADNVDFTWSHLLRKAKGLITRSRSMIGFGATFCHEIGIPCIVGTDFEESGRDPEEMESITMDCSDREGKIYKGWIPYKIEESVCIYSEPKLPFKVMTSIDTPQDLRQFSHFPCNGIDLSLNLCIEELEYHPLVFICPDQIHDEDQGEVDWMARQFGSTERWYYQQITSMIAQVCAVHPEKFVLVRLDSLTSVDYRKLRFGEYYEIPTEEFSGCERLTSTWGTWKPYLEMYAEIFRILQVDYGIFNFHVELTGVRSAKEATLIKEAILTRRSLSKFSFLFQYGNREDLDDLLNVFDGMTINLEELMMEMTGRGDGLVFSPIVSDFIGSLIQTCVKKHKTCSIYMMDLNEEWCKFLAGQEMTSVVVPPVMEGRFVQFFTKGE
jgi:pyruvate,water dikinase